MIKCVTGICRSSFSAYGGFRYVYFILKEDEFMVLLSVSIALLAGLLMTRAFKPLKLPSVTAYLIAGVLIGPYCLGALGITGLGFNSHTDVSALSVVSEVALGFIAFSIGNEFILSDLKKTGKQALTIGVLQAVVAMLLVDVALIGMHFVMPDKLSLAQAITLGAIATATAPAATLMVVRQYKAKGPLTKLLLPIVALDDAVGLIAFAVSFGIAKTLVSGEIDMISILVNPIIEIACSLILGAIMGWVLTQLEKLFNSNTNRLNLTIAAVFLTASLSMLEFHIGPVQIHFSSLLTCMMLGTVFCNMCEVSEELMSRTDRWTAPLYIMFFAVSGAQLDFSVFKDIAIVGIGVVFVVTRCLGKYFGTHFSAKAVHCPDTVVKYLGITLFPQEGVALGMTATALSLGADGTFIRNIVLFAVLIYELCGPLATKIALTKAGEITPEGKKSARGAADMAARR